MPTYDFDKIIDRSRSCSAKHSNFESLEKNLEYIPLSVADMDLAVPPVIQEAMKKVAEHGIYGYTVIDGDKRYRESIQYWLDKRFGLKIEGEDIIYSSGTLDLIRSAIYTFTNPGDGVIIQRPVYGQFTNIIENQMNRKAVDVRLVLNEENQYRMDFEALENACKQARNKIFLLCSPHNPVGRVWSKEELEKCLSICRENEILLISDEVHADLIRKEAKHLPILTLAKENDKVMQIMGISKTFNCAGLHSSYGIIPNRRLRQQIQAEFGVRLPSPFALEAQIAAYSEDGEDWLEAVKEYIDGNIDFVRSFFQEHLPEVKIIRPDGTYILWMDFSALGLEKEQIHEAIYDEAKVILQDGIVHDPMEGEYFQRMVVPSPRPLVKLACERIVDALQNKQS